ncbi:nascent polypeptide-associated complex subunit alpha, muscle-specific form-like isoform X2 [Hemicordylus capensis]|uniref:nascent polypeptide-associated complex subunit alpha, muscle-specific form-like isoform X2 n=1 Tax=Hemicordylus capensis TaxID=884348 RepID=UPI00230435D3|nr:nascent polypeptide-associated complex subunit alpha, muscle-specific form-like isoform X2 [Hemicordylus capensis]
MNPASDVDVKETVLTLLYCYPGGVPLWEFGALYRQQTGQRLELDQNGYSSLQQLLAEMKDQVVMDEMGKQPWVWSLRPWNTYHSLHSPSHTYPHQLRTKKTSNELQPHRTIYLSRKPSRLPVSAARLANRLTLSGGAHPPASRLPRPLNRLPCPGGFHECTKTRHKASTLMSIDGEEGQMMVVKEIQKCQSPVLLPTSPVVEGRKEGFSRYPPERNPSAPTGSAAAAHLPASSSTSEVLHHDDISLKPLNQEDAPNVQVPSSPAGLNCSVLLVTSQFLKRQEEEEAEAGDVATLPPEDYPQAMLPAGLLPPKDASPSAPGPLSESLDHNKHSSNVALCFPYSNALIQSSPNSLAKSGIMLSTSPNLPAALVQPVPSPSPAQGLFSAEQWSSPREKVALNEPSSISPIYPKDVLAVEEGSSLKWDSASSSDLFDLLETKMMLKEGPPQNALSSPKTAVSTSSMIPEILEEEVSPGSQSQWSSPAPSSSMEEKVLDSLEEAAAAAAASLGSGSLVFKSLENSVEGQTTIQATPPAPTKHNPCVIL